MLGFKRFDHTTMTIPGIELVHQIKKQQFDLSAICAPHARAPHVWEAVAGDLSATSSGRSLILIL